MVGRERLQTVDALRAYKEGVQSLRYLDSSIRLGYSLLRMLEKWSRERGGGELLVRKKKARRTRKGKGESPARVGGIYKTGWREDACQLVVGGSDRFDLTVIRHHDEIVAVKI